MNHAVTAHLRDGTATQVCPSARVAIRLFDRLREIAPRLRIERIEFGRVVEVGGLN